MARWITADEWPALLGPGRNVYVGASSNEPLGLVEALERAPERAAGVTFVQFPLPGLNRTNFASLHPDARVTTFFMAPQYASANAGTQSQVEFLPMQMRAVFDHLSRTAFDVVLVQLGCDRDGRLRFGPNVDFVAAAMRHARYVVAEVNRGFVAAAGCPLAPPERFDALVATDRPLAPMPASGGDEASAAIGRHIAGLVRDGACLQTGIGAVPAAVLAALGDKNDLGLHSGLIDDGGMALIRRGVINGRAKTVDQGLHVAGMALGSAALHEWLADTPEVVFRGADLTHDVGVIRELRGFLSINSAVQIDLHGQVNAEMVGGRQISGTGGSVDFMRGAKASRGGRSVVALGATARSGTLSRIVPAVEMVTALRTDVDIVVTEFGIAELRDASAAERAERLIGIAAPQFRDALRDGPRP